MKIPYLKKHPVSTALIFVFLLISYFSFYKFFIKEDYIVAYDGACDPSISSCFTICSDDSCLEKIYFSKHKKYKPDLYKECGEDITDCEAANFCAPTDRYCSIEYCTSENIDIANSESCSNFSDIIPNTN
jgi:hypothetical protein